jgi:hypothetical protein
MPLSRGYIKQNLRAYDRGGLPDGAAFGRPRSAAMGNWEALIRYSSAAGWRSRWPVFSDGL